MEVVVERRIKKGLNVSFCLAGWLLSLSPDVYSLRGLGVVVKILGVFWFKGEKGKGKRESERKEKRRGMSMDTFIEFFVMRKKKIYPSALLLTGIAVEFMPSRAGI